MKKIKNKYIQIILQLVFDTIAIISAFFIQYNLRFESGVVETSIKPDIFTTVITTTIVVLYWLLVFLFGGLYKNWYERSPFDMIFKIWKVTFVGCALIVFLIFYDGDKSPRMFFLIYFILMGVSVSIGRVIERIIEKRLRVTGIISYDTIILGNFENACNFFKKTKISKAWGYNILGIITNKSNKNPNTEIDVNILGSDENIIEILKEYEPEELIITHEHQNTKKLYDIVTMADDMGIRVKVEPDLYDIFTGQAKVQMLYGIPLIEIKSQIIKRYQEILKRVFDIIFSFTVLLIGLPLLILIAILIKIDSKGKIIFTQYRVGRNGKEFKMYKFRSMKEGSEKEKKPTAVGDKRVTLFGKFIRKTHFDELPQFFNVLIGDMSVVGPRPEIKFNVDKFSDELPQYNRRHKIRPGITGWWQVNYGPHVLNIEEIENRLKDDFYYMENYSLTLDVEIVVRTVWCVFKGHGQA